MRIPMWRLALTGGAITILAVGGLGFAAAATQHQAVVAPVAAESSTAPESSAGRLGLGNGQGLGPLKARLAPRLLHAGRHLVHVEATVTDKDGNLVNLQLDHGTVQSIGGGTITIAEAGGSTVTVSTDGDTKVWVGREKGELGDLKVGDEVFVQSRVTGASSLAKRILEVPAKAS